MLQVQPDNYNRQYYQDIFGDSQFDPQKKYFVSSHLHIFEEIAGLAQISAQDEVIDFGCGNGDLTFYLAAKFNCRITGIDYSADAIEICNEKLKKINGAFSSRINFINAANASLPVFKDIRFVVFCDVLEHMYDHEIQLVMEQLKLWGDRDKMRVLLHTDNDIYAKYIRRVIDSLSLIFKTKDRLKIKQERAFEEKLHVNITNPVKLEAKMKSLGFQRLILRYPSVSSAVVKAQLAGLARVPFLAAFCAWLLKRAAFLSPSFYAVYRINP
jgi:SAM-dependent methyltransferase